jgi:hypothetical protein
MDTDKFEQELLKLIKEFKYSTTVKSTRSELGIKLDVANTNNNPNTIIIIKCLNSTTRDAISEIIGERVEGTHIVIFRGICTVIHPISGLNSTRRLLQGNLSEECAVCLEYIGSKSTCCSQCGENICINCVKKLEENNLDEWKCPLCRATTISRTTK